MSAVHFISEIQWEAKGLREQESRMTLLKTLKRLHGLVVTQTFPATKPAVQPEECDCQKHKKGKEERNRKKPSSK